MACDSRPCFKRKKGKGGLVDYEEKEAKKGDLKLNEKRLGPPWRVRGRLLERAARDLGLEEAPSRDGRGLAARPRLGEEGRGRVGHGDWHGDYLNSVPRLHGRGVPYGVGDLVRARGDGRLQREAQRLRG